MSEKMFRLCSGEMCIGSLISESDDSIVIESPMEVLYRPAPNGQLGINLFPLNPFSSKLKDQITFHKLYHIMFFCDFIDPAIQNQYIEMTTGIKIAKPNDGKIITP